MVDKKLIKKIDAHIEKNYIDFSKVCYRISKESYLAHRKKIDDMLEKFNFSFANYLRDFIKQKNLTEVEVYKKANLDRRIFSKLRNEENYKPSKRTLLAIAIAIAMELGKEETNNLLDMLGYSLSLGIEEDLIIGYFIENKIYDLFLINDTLAHYGFKTLGS